MLKNMFMPFLDLDADYGMEGAEEPEVAELVDEEGVEDPEVAEPGMEEESVGMPDDSAWAALRRRAEAAEAYNSELEAQNSMMAEALGLYFDGDPTEMAVQARANAFGVSPDVERERVQADNARRAAETRAESLEKQLLQVRVEQAMAQGLADIQKIDPEVTDLTELGDDFANYISAGLSSTDAYFATKAKQSRTKLTPPQSIGRIKSGKAESGYFTKAEVDAMTDDEIEANLEAIDRSMKKW